IAACRHTCETERARRSPRWIEYAVKRLHPGRCEIVHGEQLTGSDEHEVADDSRVMRVERDTRSRRDRLHRPTRVPGLEYERDDPVSGVRVADIDAPDVALQVSRVGDIGRQRLQS